MIYLDNAATTKPKKEVVDVINSCLLYEWGNPSSLYKIGISAKDVLEKSRRIVADFIGAKSSEIIFTSGACESNSLAICGFLKNKNTFFITSSIEHKSIKNITGAYNYKCSVVPVDNKGFVNLNVLENYLEYQNKYKKDNVLVSIQYANNEIGTIQNIKEISKIVHKYNGTLHTDATQIIPDRKINVKKDGIDMMSFSGQKLGATKGIGVLYIKDGIKLNPIIYGSQEKELRGGTENIPYIAGLAKAIEIIKYPTSELRNYFVNKVLHEIEDCFLVGAECDNEYRLKNNASICFKGVEGESILIMLNQKDIYVSSGSACNSSDLKPSHVLTAISVPEEYINGVIRFTFSNDNTKKEVDIVVDELKKIIKKLRYFRK